MSDSNLYAVIDVGTNNVLYLLARCTVAGIEILQRDSAVSRMGLYVQDGFLLPAGVEVLQRILSRYLDAARPLTNQIIVVGTSASREVANIGEITQWLHTYHGVRYHIISGEEEARLIGLANLDEFTERRLLLYDVGGGSTEFTQVEDGSIVHTQSLQLGIRRLQAMHPADSAAQQDATRRILSQYIPPAMQGAAVVGVGGTATSLAAILAGMHHYDSAQVHRSVITRQQCDALLHGLREMPHAQLVKTLAFEPERADIIATGAMIVCEIMQYLKCQQMYVSDRGLQFGILRLPPEQLAALL
jgi:exopolyphosphatase/guanosine-5'-triphosphate,3'-diphosphate pyrophosphatase